MTTSIVVADSHEIVRGGIRRLLEAEPGCAVVGEAGDGLEAVRLVDRLRPDVLILGLMLPKLHGMDVLGVVKRRSPSTRVVVFSMYARAGWVAEALQRGAAGYVLKSGNADELVTAVREARAGRRYLSPPLAQHASDDHLERAKPIALEPIETLTPRERQVLELSAEGRTCPAIAARLHISERTVEMHRANLLHKLGLRNQTDLVLFAVHHGILPADDCDERP